MRKIILVPAFLGIMGIGGFIAMAGGSLVGSASDLSAEQIKEKALAEVNGTIREFEIEKVGNTKYYEIEIVTEDAEYELKYNASTGDLVRKYKDDLDDKRQESNHAAINQGKYDDARDDDDDNDRNIKNHIETNNVDQVQKSESNILTIPTEKTNQQIQATSTPVQTQKSDDDDRFDDDRYDDDDHYDDDRYDVDDDDDDYDDDDDDDDDNDD